MYRHYLELRLKQLFITCGGELEIVNNGHSSLNWSLRFVSATLVTLAILGEPVGATAWALLILGEMPTLMEFVGGILILAGIFVAIQKRRMPLLR